MDMQNFQMYGNAVAYIEVEVVDRKIVNPVAPIPFVPVAEIGLDIPDIGDGKPVDPLEPQYQTLLLVPDGDGFAVKKGLYFGDLMYTKGDTPESVKVLSEGPYSIADLATASTEFAEERSAAHDELPEKIMVTILSAILPKYSNEMGGLVEDHIEGPVTLTAHDKEFTLDSIQ